VRSLRFQITPRQALTGYGSYQMRTQKQNDTAFGLTYGIYFEKLWRLGPAAFVLKAIFAAIAANGLLLAFILLRRAYRKRYFAKRDMRVYELRKRWDALISGEIPFESWRRNAFDREIVRNDRAGRVRSSWAGRIGAIAEIFCGPAG